ncbi:hypothetical protein AAY473_022992 [Plecturocebus cupreus]
MHHHVRLLFAFLVEMRFHHVGQAGLELLTASDLPTSASQSAEITGLSHCARPRQQKESHVQRVEKEGCAGSVCTAGTRRKEQGISLECETSLANMVKPISKKNTKISRRQDLTVTQAGVQWHNLGSLQPQFPGPKLSSHLSLLNGVSLCHQAGVQWHNLHSQQTHFPGLSDYPASASLVALDYRCEPPRLANFCIFSRDGVSLIFSRDGAVLELLTLGEPPASASQSNGITDGVSLCHPGWSAVARSRLTETSTSQVQKPQIQGSSKPVLLVFGGESHRKQMLPRRHQVQPKFNRIQSSIETGTLKARANCEGPSRTDQHKRLLRNTTHKGKTPPIQVNAFYPKGRQNKKPLNEDRKSKRVIIPKRFLKNQNRTKENFMEEDIFEQGPAFQREQKEHSRQKARQEQSTGECRQAASRVEQAACSGPGSGTRRAMEGEGHSQKVEGLEYSKNSNRILVAALGD